VLDLAKILPYSIDEISKVLVKAEVSIGSKVGFLDDLQHNLEDLQYNTEDETTRLQEADIAQIAIDLSRREVLYQMSLSVAAKLMSLSLLDFI
jgi:flagellin-like hook-associated protein FlgL